jgi:hypothetical protein
MLIVSKCGSMLTVTSHAAHRQAPLTDYTLPVCTPHTRPHTHIGADPGLISVTGASNRCDVTPTAPPRPAAAAAAAAAAAPVPMLLFLARPLLALPTALNPAPPRRAAAAVMDRADRRGLTVVKVFDRGSNSSLKLRLRLGMPRPSGRACNSNRGGSSSDRAQPSKPDFCQCATAPSLAFLPLASAHSQPPRICACTANQSGCVHHTHRKCNPVTYTRHSPVTAPGV